MGQILSRRIAVGLYINYNLTKITLIKIQYSLAKLTLVKCTHCKNKTINHQLTKMKKTLLSALLLSSLFATAQTTSFEASEGHAEGTSVLGVNGWGTFTSAAPNVSELTLISTEHSSNGSQSVKLDSDGLASSTSSGVVMLSPAVTVGATYSLSVDLRMEGNPTDPDAISDLRVELYGPTANNMLGTASIFLFRFNNQVGYANFGIPEPAIEIIPELTYEFDTWINLTVQKNGTNIEYFINGVSVATTVVNSQIPAPNRVCIRHDNFGTATFVDNISGSESLNVDTFTADSFRIYPNPAQDKISVTLAHAQVLEGVKIFDINGRLVKSFQATEMNNTFDIADLNAGVYMVEVSSEAGSATKKLVKN